MKTKSRWYAAAGVERKKITGEVFTPEFMGQSMLDLLLAHDPSLIFGTFLDPSCGDGNLLMCVLRRKIEKGIDPCEALGSIYGIELMEDNVIRCRQRLVECAIEHVGEDNSYETCLNIINSVLDSSYPRIVCHDILTWDVEHWRPTNMVVSDWLEW